MSTPEPRCAMLLASLLMYAKHPATPNSSGWVSIIVPADFLPQAEWAIAEDMASSPIVSAPDGLPQYMARGWGGGAQG